MRTTNSQRQLPVILAWLLLCAVMLAPFGGLRAQQARQRTGTKNSAQSASTFAPYHRQPSKKALTWADTELRRMTLDEKIGQMIAVGINATFLNQESAEFKELRRQVEQNHVGGLILFRGP
ncbi:MAG TPA: hypothetical protein VE821_07895, partial [Pyrinomonadaceae bacterium]|nr:hypothetical protein [Pyrinomonadaceae bacterium]